MKLQTFSSVCFTAIVSATAIIMTALTLDFTSVVDLGCNSDGCKVRLEKISTGG